jgi:hypothetical protein
MAVPARMHLRPQQQHQHPVVVEGVVSDSGVVVHQGPAAAGYSAAQLKPVSLTRVVEGVLLFIAGGTVTVVRKFVEILFLYRRVQQTQTVRLNTI